MKTAPEQDQSIYGLANQVRTEPKSFIPILEEYITKFQDKFTVKRGPGRSKIKTKDGVDAVYEASGAAVGV